LAYCEAFRAFKPARGVPWDEFVYQQVLARVWARLRRERAFGRRHQADGSEPEPAVDPAASVNPTELLDRVLDHLEDADRQFLQQLYHEGHTEKDLAALLGTNRSAVNKRKRRLLKRLRRLLEKIDPDLRFFEAQIGPILHS